MNKDIKDYLPFYLGCEVSVRGSIEKLIGVEGDAAITFSGRYGRRIWSMKEIKLILHQLSDMTEDEYKEASIVRGEGDGLMNNVAEAHEFKYLLSKHFDLFGLIESGLAIDKTTLKISA